MNPGRKEAVDRLAAADRSNTALKYWERYLEASHNYRDIAIESKIVIRSTEIAPKVREFLIPSSFHQLAHASCIGQN